MIGAGSLAASAQGGTSTACRDRYRQLLLRLEDDGPLEAASLEAVIRSTSCAHGHELRVADLPRLHFERSSPGVLQISKAGREWLLEADRPTPDWDIHRHRGSFPLRVWQAEALGAWCRHGRHGVVEAVTGTGKSRVGIEAAREALRDDYNVIVMVPTIDLVEQWVKSLREGGVTSVGALGDGQKADFRSHRVVVGTVQSLYSAPPTRSDGKVLLVADECHRYGAGQWSRALHPSYRRRLGLTATFERNDDGIAALQGFFGGPPIYRIGFPRAIADGVVARYDVKLLGVRLTPRERAEYDEADEIVRDARLRLIAAGFPAEPFGAFLHEVQEAAKEDADPTIADVARRYLKAFSQRIDVMTSAQAKLDVMGMLAPQVAESGGAIVFTRRVETAEELSDALADGGVKSAAVHSDLSRSQRKERLRALKKGRLKAVVAPTVLDEGIDVPDIDLAVVMGGSKSRRQMIQRMGRVLRLKPDGRTATFVVVYATNTAEDLTKTDGTEGCLDLIVESADSVTALTVRDGKVVPSDLVYRKKPAAAQATSVPTTATTSMPLDQQALRAIDARTLPMTRKALNCYAGAHGVDDPVAEADLRRLLDDLLVSKTATVSRHMDRYVLREEGFELVVTKDRFVHYKSARPDALTWIDLRDGEPEQAIRDGSAVNEPSPQAGTSPRQPGPSALRSEAKSPTELIAAEPTIVLELLDPTSVAFAGDAVTRGADQFSLGDPFEESVLEALRGMLAEDLANGASVSIHDDRLVIEGSRAAWQLRADAQAVTGVEAHLYPDETMEKDLESELGVPGASDGVSSAAHPVPDLVDQLERLASMRERGYLTGVEFAAAKAQLLT